MSSKKTYITFAEYKAYKDKVESETDYDKRDEMEKACSKLYGSIMPEVGMGATEVLYSDCRAKTIVKVITPNKIEVAENETKCLDYYGNNYEVLDTLSRMPHEIYTRRKNGVWVMEGQPNKRGSVYLHLGYRYHSIDPSF